MIKASPWLGFLVRKFRSFIYFLATSGRHLSQSERYKTKRNLAQCITRLFFYKKVSYFSSTKDFQYLTADFLNFFIEKSWFSSSTFL